MAEARDYPLLRSKRKAVGALLPYAVWQERDGRPEMLIAILHAARASRMGWFMWHHVGRLVGAPLSNASPDTIVLVSPHIPWDSLTDKESLVQRWVVAASTVEHTEEATRDVVDTLLQIASNSSPLQHITAEVWSQLTKRPSLPPICKGRCLGTDGHVVEAVRALKDVEILKSYYLLVWSEWDCLYNDGFCKMCISILEDFSGIGMGHHRADLIQRLDHVLEQLDCGLEHFKQHNPQFGEDVLRIRKVQYQQLRETLLGSEYGSD